jgi:hypothetical protein
MWAKPGLIFLLSGIILCSAGLAEIYNGDFELAEPNGIMDQYGNTFYPPLGWERHRYAAVTDLFIPYPPDYNDSRSSLDFWKIDVNEGVSPKVGESFVVVASGSLDLDDVNGVIWQPIYVCPNQVISGYYFFGSVDWIEDWAEITLVPQGVDPNLNPDIEILKIYVSDIGPSSSMEDWGYFEHAITEEQMGGYNLLIKVEDEVDDAYTSYLLVDGLSLSPYPLADLNHDCWVNFLDFNILARDWLQDCNDPVYLEDPDNFCYRGTNIDETGLVDYNDLAIMSDRWLFQFREPNEPNEPL